MARPQPTVLLTYEDPDSNSGYEVVAADAYYAIMYQCKPINLKTWTDIELKNVVGYGPKYPKCVYSNSAACINLVKKLNKDFKTQEFTAVEIKTNSIRTLRIEK